jgi:hypothetical protein
VILATDAVAVAAISTAGVVLVALVAIIPTLTSLLKTTRTTASTLDDNREELGQVHVLVDGRLTEALELITTLRDHIITDGRSSPLAPDVAATVAKVVGPRRGPDARTRATDRPGPAATP